MPNYSMYVKSPKLVCIRCKQCGWEAYSTKEVLKTMRFTCRSCGHHKYGKVA